MARGECNCSAIGFEIRAELSDVFVCHCSICRRATGSSGIAVVVVDNADFRWSRGEEYVTSWKKPDADWQMSFCKIKAVWDVIGDSARQHREAFER
jgi:hypothetical protein